MAHPQYLNTHSVTDSPLREYISVSQKTYAFLFLFGYMEEIYAMVEPISDELAYQYDQELAMWELKSIQELERP